MLQRIGPREHRLLVVFHQLVFDRRSAELFVADLTAFYRAEVEERKPELPALTGGTGRR